MTHLGTQLVRILSIFFALSFASILMIGSYYDQPITQALSYEVDDLNCEPKTQGLGRHCFSDFQLPNVLLNEPEVWDEMQYSPTALVPHIIANESSKLIGDRSALTLYLVLLSTALLIPAVLVSLSARSINDRILPLLLMGMGSIPFIFTVDRGNSIGFAVPFLLVFACRLRAKSDWTVVAAIILASSLRPQFVLLVIGLIAFRQYKNVLLVALGSILINITPFIFIRGDRSENISNWLRNISDYRNYSSLSEIYPVKLSLVQAVYNIFDFVNFSVGERFVTQHASEISIVTLVVIVCVVLVFQKNTTGPIAVILSLILPTLLISSSFGYYSVFVLVVAALICIRHEFDDQSRRWRWTLVSATALTMAPFPFVIEVGRNSFLLEQFGLIWAFVLIVTLFELSHVHKSEVKP